MWASIWFTCRAWRSSSGGTLRASQGWRVEVRYSRDAARNPTAKDRFRGLTGDIVGRVLEIQSAVDVDRARASLVCLCLDEGANG